MCLRCGRTTHPYEKWPMGGVPARRLWVAAPEQATYRDLGVELTAAGRAVTIPCS